MRFQSLRVVSESLGKNRDRCGLGQVIKGAKARLQCCQNGPQVST